MKKFLTLITLLMLGFTLDTRAMNRLSRTIIHGKSLLGRSLSSPTWPNGVWIDTWKKPVVEPKGYSNYQGNLFQRALHSTKLLYAGRFHGYSYSKHWEFDRTEHLAFAARIGDIHGLRWYLRNGHVNFRAINIAKNRIYAHSPKCWGASYDIREELDNECTYRKERIKYPYYFD